MLWRPPFSGGAEAPVCLPPPPPPAVVDAYRDSPPMYRRSILIDWLGNSTTNETDVLDSFNFSIAQWLTKIPFPLVERWNGADWRTTRVGGVCSRRRRRRDASRSRHSAQPRRATVELVRTHTASTRHFCCCCCCCCCGFSTLVFRSAGRGCTCSREKKGGIGAPWRDSVTLSSS